MFVLTVFVLTRIYFIYIYREKNLNVDGILDALVPGDLSRLTGFPIKRDLLYSGSRLIVRRINGIFG